MTAIVIVCDLDGVITSEDGYWTAAGLTVHELMNSSGYWGHDTAYAAPDGGAARAVARRVLPEAEILELKARAVNNNWDICHIAACRRLVAAMCAIRERAPLLPLLPTDPQWLGRFRAAIRVDADEPDESDEPGQFGQFGQTGPGQTDSLPVRAGADILATPLMIDQTGFTLVGNLDAAAHYLGIATEGALRRHGALWLLCQRLFTDHYREDGDLAVPSARIRSTLGTLRDRGYRLAVATGRPLAEAVAPLRQHGLLDLFDPERFITDDDVVAAERLHADTAPLAKPHPFVFEQAGGPGCFVVIGDSASDVIGGRDAGALTIAVRSGAPTEAARLRLAESKPDFTIDDIGAVPTLLAEVDDLGTIQRMQRSARETAQRLLRLWFQCHLDLVFDAVELRPHAVSLNSFNGVAKRGTDAWFFKTHVESGSSLTEYYNAEVLRNVGYDTVVPLRVEQAEGRQMVFYPVVADPVMFDLVRALETAPAAFAELGSTAAAVHVPTAGVAAVDLADAEREEGVRLLAIYRATAAITTAEENAAAPIHQLFWHRLVGGRFDAFYRDATLSLPGSARSLTFDEVLGVAWVINGAAADLTLGSALGRARAVLDPHRAGLTVVGHGDAHFGNVFLIDGRYRYFDPAFAGRHAPLLDVVKPWFHNGFANWMYFPHELNRTLAVTVAVEANTVCVNYDRDALLTPVRRLILDAKLEGLLIPLVTWLGAANALPEEWAENVRSALMCCALLTLNLCDAERFPAEISWLGMAVAVELASSSHDLAGVSRIVDRVGSAIEPMGDGPSSSEVVIPIC